MAEPKAVAVIMAGGSGTRFWPASCRHFPKQFLALTGHQTLIEQTVDRLAPLVPASRTYVCAVASQQELLTRFVPQVKRFVEPQGKNTAPCLMLSLSLLQKAGLSGDTVMVALPADHHIADGEAFRRYLGEAIRLAGQRRGLVTLGVRPQSPHTGYGYIEAGGAVPGTSAFEVARFIEKPPRDRAEAFVAQQGRYFWNAGIFAWRLEALEEAFERYLPEAWHQVSTCQTTAELERVYESLPSVSIDVAVMEKAANVVVLPVQMGWSDLGSWGALYELHAPLGDKNVALSGEAHYIDSHRCLIQIPQGKQIALVGVCDLIVVEKDGVLLITQRGHDQKVREAAALLDRP